MWQVRQTASALRELYVDRRPELRHAGWSSGPIWDARPPPRTRSPTRSGSDVHPDVRVRERSFGDWEGIPVEELAQRYPEDYRLARSVAANSNTVPNPRRKSDVVASKR